jgi:hypothetical protein
MLMKRLSMIPAFLLIINACTLASPVSPSSPSGTLVPGGHRGTVTVLLADPHGHVLSAGTDGFLGVWDTRKNTAVERFQLSTFPITAMVLRPDSPQLAVVERSDTGVSRISCWDYIQRKKLWTSTVTDPVSVLRYSAAGTFLIITDNNTTRFVDPETGSVLPTAFSKEKVDNTLLFAATGRSEKTMISYQSYGVLSYWDLATGAEVRHFSVPAQLKYPVLFGSNGLLAGADSAGLVVLNAVSGAVITRERSINPELILPVTPDMTEFICISSTIVFYFRLSPTGRLEITNRSIIPSYLTPVTSAVAVDDSLVLGTASGALWQLDKNNILQQLTTENQSKITAAAVSDYDLVFITDTQYAGFIPSDYTQLKNNTVIQLEKIAHTNITTAPPNNDIPERFLLWQTHDTQTVPVLLTISDDGARTEMPLEKLSLKFPIRSATLSDNNILFLDSMGNIQILSADTGDSLFSYSSIGSLDVAFWDEHTIIIGRSGRQNNETPFLRIDITTGETVAMQYPAAIGVKLYHGASKTMYAAIVNENNHNTTILSLDADRLIPLAEAAGEDLDPSIAEVAGRIASTLGGEGASLYDPALPFARSTGFPVELINGINAFITLDADGTVAWHNPYSGRLYASFRLYEDRWIAQIGSKTIQGRVEQHYVDTDEPLPDTDTPLHG